MPRVYIAANSGARIGFADDVKRKLNVVWNDSDHPEDGFQYLNIDCESSDDAVLKQIEYTKKGDKFCIDAVIGKEVIYFKKLKKKILERYWCGKFGRFWSYCW